jgi:hypothetical protein
MSQAISASREREHFEPKAGSQQLFARRMLIFFLPLAIILLMVETLLWITGEDWPISKVMQKQEIQSSSLFMRGIMDQGFYAYKLKQIQRKKPKILVIGSSRVMEFRMEMMGAGAAEFYNAGGILQDISDLTELVKRLSSKAFPEVLILGIDLWWFNPDRPTGEGLKANWNNDAATDWHEHVRAWRKFKSSKGWRMAFDGVLATNANIGLEARNQNVGFRSDGSMQYNFPIPKTESEWKFKDRENPPIPDRLQKKSGQFPESVGISKERVRELGDALLQLKHAGVMVLGFLPPFSSESSMLLESMPEHATLWGEFRREIPNLFARFDFPLVDASKPAELGLDDTYLVDGIHGGETFHLHVLKRFLLARRMAEKFSGLSEKIESALKSPGTNPWQPDYSALRSAP